MVPTERCSYHTQNLVPRLNSLDFPAGTTTTFKSGACGETCEDDFNTWWEGGCKAYGQKLMTARDSALNNTAQMEDLELMATKCKAAQPVLSPWVVLAIIVGGVIIVAGMVFVFLKESEDKDKHNNIDLAKVAKIHREKEKEESGIDYGTNDNMATAATRRVHDLSDESSGSVF